MIVAPPTLERHEMSRRTHRRQRHVARCTTFATTSIMLGRRASAALAVFLSVVMLFACSSGDETAGSEGSKPSQTPEANKGREGARALLGLAAKPEVPDDRALAT